MKKFLALFILAGLIFGAGCNSKDDTKLKSERLSGKEDENETITSKNDKEDDSEDASGSDINKAAEAACDCMSSVTDDLSSRTRNMFIKAANSSDPQQTIQSEMLKIDDAEEQQEIQAEMQKLAAIQSDPDVKECAERVDRKYKVNSNDRATQRKMVTAFEEADGCELVAAFMKIALKTGAMN